jgi:hypothetical protein
MAQDDAAARRAVGGEPALAHCKKLRALASWYRDFAERAGNTDVWEARLRTAEELDAEAARLEASAAPDAAAPASAEALRREARRLLDEVANAPDADTKRQLAAHALALAQRAEALTVWREEPAIIALNIERYRAMLAAGIDEASQRRLVEDMLSDAEAALMIRRLAAT